MNTPFAAFLARKAEFDDLLADLQRMSEDHFGAGPDAVTWGHAAGIGGWTTKLREVTDAYFKRGEYAD